MFERFTEKARRVIFFGRYEASQVGSPFIETEHVLLGILREDKALMRRFLRVGAAESIRKEIEQHTQVREKVPTSVDLPLSEESKRVFHHSAEEADRLNQKHIGTEHLLLGLLREDKCFAARLLQERGLVLEDLRSDLALNPNETPVVDPLRVRSGSSRAVAEHNYLIPIKTDHPLVGRELELERVLQVLGRRHGKNPVLVGEHGVGKRAIISGLAQRITEGTVPSFLTDATLVALATPARGAMSGSECEGFQDALLKAAQGGAILVVDELHTSSDRASEKSSSPVQEILKGLVISGKVQVLSIATPAGFSRSIADHRWLEFCFQAVQIAPASHEETSRILGGIKNEFEEFHGVTYLDEAIERSIACAKACLPGRCLPGGAVDVMDEAGSLVKFRTGKLPEEVVEIQKHLRFILRRLEASIHNHEFEKARFYSDEEKRERAGLSALRAKLRATEPNALPVVTGADVEKAVSGLTGLSLETVLKMLRTG